MTEITGRDFGRLEGKVDELIRLIAERSTRLDAMETRVRKVESRQHYWAGGGTVIGALIGFFARQHI